MSVKRHSAYNLTGSLIPIAAALVTIPLYLDLIGAEKYGVLSIAFLFLGYFGLFDLGLSKATAFRVAETGHDENATKRSILWTAILINIALGSVGAITVFWLSTVFFQHYFDAASGLRGEIVESLPLLALCLPVSTLTGVLTGALQASYRFLDTNVISVSSTLLFQLLPLVAATTVGSDLTILLGAALVARVAAILVLLLRCHQVFDLKGRPTPSKAEAHKLLGYGGWLLLDSLLAPFVSLIDRFVIGSAFGGAAVSAYTIPYQFAQRVTIVPSALMTAVFPNLPTADERRRRDIATQSVSTLLSFLSIPILIAIFFSEPFFQLWIGSELGEEAAVLATVILVGFWVNAISWAPYVWLQGTGHPKAVALIHLAEVVPYATVLYYAMSFYGLLGVAFAFVFRNCLDLVLLSWSAGLRRELFKIAHFLVALTAAAFAANWFQWLSISWIATLVVLTSYLTAISWRNLPPSAVRMIYSRLRKA